MDLFVKWTKDFTTGRKTFRKGTYALLTLGDVKEKTAYILNGTAEYKIKLDEFFDAVEVLA